MIYIFLFNNSSMVFIAWITISSWKCRPTTCMKTILRRNVSKWLLFSVMHTWTPMGQPSAPTVASRAHLCKESRKRWKQAKSIDTCGKCQQRLDSLWAEPGLPRSPWWPGAPRQGFEKQIWTGNKRIRGEGSVFVTVLIRGPVSYVNYLQV